MAVTLGRILLIEDEQIFARAVARRLERAGYTCRVEGTIKDAQLAFDDLAPELLLLDMRLPDGSGLDLLERLNGTVPVIVMTAYGEVEDAVSAMKLSASDYLKKPIDLEELLLAVQKVLANDKVANQLKNSRAREARGGDTISLVGRSHQAEALRSQIAQYARLCSGVGPPAPTVLISGETGSGKDVVARLLHQQSGRSPNPFVHVDCASLPKDLIEAELFGHVKGAFTNANSDRVGLIEMAEDGVVFLDEIGELPMDLQGKLLAVLERRMLRRVGSSRERPIGAWFMAATNRDIGSMVADGSLRSDLYFRLNVLSLELPPLRNRIEDIVLLSEYFGAQTVKRYGIGTFSLDQQAKKSLCEYTWPGNVRELRHVVERATLLSEGGALGDAQLMLPKRTGAVPGNAANFSDLTLDQAERSLIELALERCGNNVSAASRQLGITRMAMRYRMKRHSLE